jgi:type I restriction enzyme S subunit
LSSGKTAKTRIDNSNLQSRPKGWCIATIGDTGRYINGFAFKPGHREAIGRPIVRIQNLTDPDKPLNRTTLSVPTAYNVATGEMLLSWSATVDVFVWNREPALVNQHIFRVAPDVQLVDKTFLFHWLKVSIDQLLKSEHLHGSTMKHINRGPFMAHEIPLPPRAEQERIADKLEELLSDLDAGVAELKAAQRKLAQYRQSLLKAAVEGALTADWRAARAQSGEPQETGADLLQRILTERRTRWETRQLAKFAEQRKTPPKDWKAKYAEPVLPDTAGLSTLPESWVWSSIGQCFHVAVGATPSRKEHAYWDGNIPWVSSGEVRFARITSTKEQITENGLNNTSTQINPVGSVLLGMIGEGKTRGQVAILDIEAANNQNCAAIWASETDVPSEHVYYWLWSRYEETRRGSSGNNQPALNKSIVEAIPFPLPPLDELREIVTRVENSLAQSNQQEAAIAYALKQSAAQRKNILKAAFAGQMVPQDPNDEPASLLLERIRAAKVERADKAKPVAKRGRKA